jgi:hypothetical protein
LAVTKQIRLHTPILDHTLQQAGYDEDIYNYDEHPWPKTIACVSTALRFVIIPASMLTTIAGIASTFSLLLVSLFSAICLAGFSKTAVSSSPDESAL